MTLFPQGKTANDRVRSHKQPKNIKSSAHYQRHALACYALIEMNRKLNHALASLVLMYSATAWSQETTMATINGEGEYTISGSTRCGRGETTASIKSGERFIARELSYGKKAWAVYLRSGVSGAIPRNRIRVLPDEPLAKLNFAGCKEKWRN